MRERLRRFFSAVIEPFLPRRDPALEKALEIMETIANRPHPTKPEYVVAYQYELDQIRMLLEVAAKR